MKVLKKQYVSERQLALRSGVSRETVRKVLRGDASVTIKNQRRVLATLSPSNDTRPHESDNSTAVVSMLVAQDGKWMIHFFNFVDAFRRTKDPLLVALPPVKALGERERSLLAAMVCTLCDELSINKPAWAMRPMYLRDPWFVAGYESLKASALVESGAYFKRNNIFVLGNFLCRA